MDRNPVEIVRAANETLIANEDLDRIGDFFSPGFVAHLTDADMTGGHEAIRRFLTSLRGAFSDLQAEVQILAESNDRVAWQRTWRGTQDGAYQGFPAIGKHIVWRDMVVSRVENGLLVEDWSITDLAEQLLRARKR